jgi:hypothetical protein
LEIHISDGQGHKPWWASAVEERLQQLDVLEADWNSHGADAPEPGSMLLAVRVIAALLGTQPGRSLPQIVPTRRGGLQLEWHFPDHDIEITFDPSDAVWAYINDRHGSDDGPLTEKESAIVQILSHQAH